MKMDKAKLQEWAKRVHKNACAHGFHDEKKSDGHWLCMIMTEVAEAVEADRKEQRADMESFRKFSMKGDSNVHTAWYDSLYKSYIKGSLEEEFADICIRIFDFAFEKHGERMKWWGYDDVRIGDNWSFTETAYHFLHHVLNSGTMNLSESIWFMYEWASKLGIDLDWHIEMKMRYNESRPILHGKKY